MALTVTEKILARHCDREKVTPGEFIMAKVDFLFANDITAPFAIEEFEKAGADKVFARDRIAFVLDHFTPAKDVESAEQAKLVREFAKRYDIKYLFKEGKGIEHALIPQEGLALPGEVIIGADSHTCTYGALGAFSTGVGSTDAAFAMMNGEIWLKVPETIKFVYSGKLRRWVSGKDLILYTIGDIGVNGANYCAMELSGEVIEKLSMDSRFTMANMAIEAGAKSCIIEPDGITGDYLHNVPHVRKKINQPVPSRSGDLSRGKMRETSPAMSGDLSHSKMRETSPDVDMGSGKLSCRTLQHFEKEQTGIDCKSDPDAVYRQVIEYDVTKLEPQVALPPSPGNVKPVGEVNSINIDQVVIGSCTNGRIEDLRVSAKILKGNKIHECIRTIIIPATEKIYLSALREGLIEIFIDSGAIISPPTCGPCLGGHMGVLAKGEKAVATTNRNFTGRMGHPESEVYLSNPAVAAASAIKGRIAHPDEVVRK